MPRIKKPEKYYSPAEIAEQRLFPWIIDRKSIIAWIVKEIKAGHSRRYGLIKKVPDTKGKLAKHGLRYFVTQTGINKIQAKFNDGSLFNGR